MRIIGGKYKGRQIYPDKHFKARPTTDFAKESLFNILVNQYEFLELEVLDLFSGTGSMAYEFASRGCKNVVAVEKNNRHTAFIKKTVEKLEIQEVEVIKSDVFQYMKWCNSQFDIVFADPPYDLSNMDDIPDRVFAAEILKSSGLLILEHSKKNSFITHPKFWEIRKYGMVHFSFFRRPKE